MSDDELDYETSYENPANEIAELQWMIAEAQSRLLRLHRLMVNLDAIIPDQETH